eukprot:3913443-Amphidinium_carterae.1
MNHRRNISCGYANLSSAGVSLTNLPGTKKREKRPNTKAGIRDSRWKSLAEPCSDAVVFMLLNQAESLQ